MATLNMPQIPLPPQDPTPPTPDSDSSKAMDIPLASDRGNLMSPDQDAFLSPYKENFQYRRPPSPSYGVEQPFSPGNQPLSPYSPMIPFSPAYQSMSGEPLSHNGKAPTPFNFQPMPLAKSPVTKSVCDAVKGRIILTGI
jgi:hypothetical protein